MLDFLGIRRQTRLLGKKNSNDPIPKNDIILSKTKQILYILTFLVTKRSRKNLFWKARNNSYKQTMQLDL